MISESRMEESEVYLRGESQAIKIIDKTKRAFDISLDSTKAFELALQKPRDSCKYRCIRFRAMFYSLWLLMMKHHGKPPGANGLNWLFFGFAATISIDILLTFVIYIHVLSPLDNVWTFGIPWLFILPCLTFLAPLWGFMGSMIGSPGMLKTYSSMNATVFLLNYPLTLAYMVWLEQSVFYLGIMVTLIFTKIFLSFMGGKVR